MNKNRKGFTVVELVIVIAIIAILAAVLIPTFASLIAKANVSVDTQLVRNLNNALTAEKAGGENNKTMYDALMMVKSAGYDIDTIVSKSGNNIAWDSKNDRFVLIDPNNNTYIYPTESGADSYTIATPVDFFVIYNEVPALANQRYSVYLSKNATVAPAVEVKVGFDAGENTAVTELTYKGVGTAQNVVIRTNSFATTLTINDSSAQGKIYHYDNLGKLIITDCAMESYHEMGIVGYAELQNGHLAVEENASINLLFANSPDSANLKITNNGTITNAQASNDDVKQSNTISGVNFNRASGAVSDTVIQQAVQETHQTNCEHANVKITKEAKDPTCITDGCTVEKTCNDCNKIVVVSETLSKTGHNLSYTAKKDATCTEAGNVEYWTCSVCDKMFAEEDATNVITDNVIPVKDHTYNETTHKCDYCQKVDPAWENFIDDTDSSKNKIDANGNLKSYAFRNNTEITEIIIPEGVKGIGTAAFSGCKNLQSVTIPESVTAIGAEAFKGCEKLDPLTIPDSVTSIAQSAFLDCKGLKSITIPDGVTMIDAKTFKGCTSLATIYIGKGVTSITGGVDGAFVGTAPTTITVSSENTSFKSVGNCLLSYDGTELVLGTANNSSIPNTVTTIRSYAYYMHTQLTEIDIPQSVTTIGEYAFASTGLTNVTIPQRVTTIGKCAFMKCAALTTVTLNANITEIAEGLFSQCSSLSSVTIPATVNKIGASAFNSCTSLTSIVIPASVETIGKQAFMGSGLTSAQISGTWTAGGTNISRYFKSETENANCLNGGKIVNGVPLATQTWTRTK